MGSSSDSSVSYRWYKGGNSCAWDRAVSRANGSGRHTAGHSTTYGSLNSTRGVPCRTEFVNRTDVTLRVLWLDFKGEKVEYSIMPPGGSYRRLRTYSTHPWVLEDPDGTVYAVYVGGSATVTVHGRDSFTVMSGVQRPNTAVVKDSIQNRIIELLKSSNKKHDSASCLPHIKREELPTAKSKSMALAQKFHNNVKLLSVDSEQNQKINVWSALRWFGWCVQKKNTPTGLKTVVMENTVSSPEESTSHACAVCCDGLANNVWALSCGHMFHGDCLARSCEEHLECPVCRQEIVGQADLTRLYPS